VSLVVIAVLADAFFFVTMASVIIKVATGTRFQSNCFLPVLQNCVIRLTL